MPGSRETRIDLVRGISLLFIFVDHSDVSFSTLLQQSRGFCDAAELFVMMAGMSAALAYAPPGGRANLGRVGSRTWRRAFKLYRVHLVLLAAMLAAVAMLPLPWSQELRSAWALDPVFAAPWRYALEAVSLRYMPADLDILPLYVLLIAAVPLFLGIAQRSAMLALGLSLGLWLAAGLLHLNLTNLAEARSGWFFNPFSWQLIFLCGLLAGLRIKRGEEPFPYSRPVFVAAALFALVAIPANLYMQLEVSADSPVRHLLMSKTSEGPLRVLNALAIAYVVFNLDALKRVFAWSWLGPVHAAGRNSLPIFVTGIVLSNTAAAVVICHGSFPLALELTAIAIGLAIQLAVAHHLGRTRREPSGEPVSSLVVASPEDQDYGYAQATEPAAIPDAARNSAT
ncbi:hypothetical protein E3C22_21125 [Jiella endophytica]|uniref:OpgC domain-containing protein n=1 Tax=Jiella endophytica TaxID=2558362 RepID=A0A4Y8RCL5_9HYPH|nr:OpgC domain-containing protein [Jiella endophytica]TFF18729.1 hypothetical protein E3C22_21125 [Jiella endophytica]